MNEWTGGDPDARAVSAGDDAGDECPGDSGTKTGGDSEVNTGVCDLVATAGAATGGDWWAKIAATAGEDWTTLGDTQDGDSGAKTGTELACNCLGTLLS